MEFYPVDDKRWPDLVRLFEHHGNPGYCWCMRWRARGGAFLKLKTDGRREALRHQVRTGIPVGIIGYLDGDPVAWCSVAPRETYAALEHSRILKRIDDAPVWAIVCLYLDRRIRGQGLTPRVLSAAVDYALAQGATIVEGYPVDRASRGSGSYMWMGLPAAFREAEFQEVARPGTGRYIMRYTAS